MFTSKFSESESFSSGKKPVKFLKRVFLQILSTTCKRKLKKDCFSNIPLNVVVLVLWSTKYGIPSGVYLISQLGGRGLFAACLKNHKDCSGSTFL